MGRPRDSGGVPPRSKWDEHAVVLRRSLGGREKWLRRKLERTIESLQTKSASGNTIYGNCDWAIAFYNHLLSANGFKPVKHTTNKPPEPKPPQSKPPQSKIVICIDSDSPKICKVCLSSKNLTHCSTCPLAFHVECIRPIVRESLPSNWSCAFCVAKDFAGYKKEDKVRRRAQDGIRAMKKLAEIKMAERGGSESVSSGSGKRSVGSGKRKAEKLEERSPEVHSWSGKRKAEKLEERSPDAHRTRREKSMVERSPDAHRTREKSMVERSPDAHRTRRVRKQPTLFDPQSCAASEWQSDFLADSLVKEEEEEEEEYAEEADRESSEESFSEEDDMSQETEEPEEHVTPIRIGSPWCDFCQDDKSISVCCFCACRVCFSKHDEKKLLLCDNCDGEYHIYCLTPRLKEVPKDKTWFCPNCRDLRGKARQQSQKKRMMKATAPKADPPIVVRVRTKFTPHGKLIPEGIVNCTLEFSDDESTTSQGPPSARSSLDASHSARSSLEASAPHSTGHKTKHTSQGPPSAHKSKHISQGPPSARSSLEASENIYTTRPSLESSGSHSSINHGHNTRHSKKVALSPVPIMPPKKVENKPSEHPSEVKEKPFIPMLPEISCQVHADGDKPPPMDIPLEVENPKPEMNVDTTNKEVPSVSLPEDKAPSNPLPCLATEEKVPDIVMEDATEDTPKEIIPEDTKKPISEDVVMTSDIPKEEENLKMDTPAPLDSIQRSLDETSKSAPLPAQNVIDLDATITESKSDTEKLPEICPHTIDLDDDQPLTDSSLEKKEEVVSSQPPLVRPVEPLVKDETPKKENSDIADKKAPVKEFLVMNESAPVKNDVVIEDKIAPVKENIEPMKKITVATKESPPPKEATAAVKENPPPVKETITTPKENPPVKPAIVPTNPPKVTTSTPPSLPSPPHKIQRSQSEPTPSPNIQRSRSGRFVKKNSLFEDIEEGEQHLRSPQYAAKKAAMERKMPEMPVLPQPVKEDPVKKDPVSVEPPPPARAVSLPPDTKLPPVVQPTAAVETTAQVMEAPASFPIVAQSSNDIEGGENQPPPAKVPRRKPGARECMQISRRFGVNVISQKYMDILLDYCTRGKVEHLIRMRERLDEHSRALEAQLAGLEALVKEKGELDITVAPDGKEEGVP